MSTRDRENSATMTQHVGLKGHNGCDIFLDEEDREVFLEKVEQACDTSGVQVSAWALMSNHVHLLMHGDMKDFPSFFQSLGRALATHNANKYEHSGALLNGRYYANPIQTAEQFCQTAAYIFNNLVAAGQVKNPEDSNWTNLATAIISSLASAIVASCVALARSKTNKTQKQLLLSLYLFTSRERN